MPDMLHGKSPSQAEAWHILQYSDTLDLEFATALSEFVKVSLWKPERTLLPPGPTLRQAGTLPSASPLCIQSFSVMRGFARFPFSLFARTGTSITSRLLQGVMEPGRAVLVCTTPFFAPVAERWPGPVIYWLSDLMARYDHVSFRRVRRLDRRLCRTATLVCPNSERIKAYLQDEAHCSPARVHLLPNATGIQSLLPAPLLSPAPLPASVEHLPRPLAGVIGNLAENTDWLFLERLLELTPWLYWLFVGPATMPIREGRQRRARHRVMQHPRTHFIGAQPYTELHRYARGIDVAILPYNKREPTFSGSSTRFYDHLAAGHPILATTGVAELRDRQPLLTLVHSAEEGAAALEHLRSTGFGDGLRQARWEASRTSTWQQRAESMCMELQRRLLS